MIFALGAFDGFHKGHQKLLSMAAQRAADKGVEWGVITFDINPRQLFNRFDFKLLFTTKEKDIISKFLEIPFIYKIPFTSELASMSPEEFLRYISSKEEIDGLVIGENFCFGKGRKGTPKKLAYLCEKLNWSLDVLDTHKIDEEVVSSTTIREAILLGNVEKASKLLGFPFIISGMVEKGDGRGRVLGYPTANIKVNDNKVYPAIGSYSALTYIKGEWHRVALNIGYNTTFTENKDFTCEAHILNFNGHLYDKMLTLFVIARNREEIKFSDSKALKSQLKKDMLLISSTVSGYLKKYSSVIKKFELNYFDM